MEGRWLSSLEQLKAEIEQLEGQRPLFTSRSYEERHLISSLNKIYTILKEHDDRLREIERLVIPPE